MAPGVSAAVSAACAVGEVGGAKLRVVPVMVAPLSALAEVVEVDTASTLLLMLLAGTSCEMLTVAVREPGV